MKNKLLIGMAVASFSLSAFAQDTRVIGNVTIQYPGTIGNTYSPQPGVTIELGGRNLRNNNNAVNANTNKNTTMPTTPSMGTGNGIDGGAPDLSEYQAQSMASAQALNNQPIDPSAAPEGAESILRGGLQALEAGNTKQLNAMSKQSNNGQTVKDISNNGINYEANLKQVSNSMSIKNEEPKIGVVVTDISDWNQGTIKQFEKEGKERTEQRYKDFLNNK